MEKTATIPEESVSRWSIENLGLDRIQQLVRDMTPTDKVRAGRKQGVHIIDGSDPDSDIARFVEWKVFDVEFHNDLEEMSDLYSLYDSTSTFLVVLDYENSTPVGVVRLIEPTDVGNLTLKEITHPDSPWYNENETEKLRLLEIGNIPERTLDIATMAVMPEYRSSHAIDGTSAALYSTCVQWSLSHGYDIWTTIVDQKIFNQMQSWGEPFTPFTGTEFKPYMGSSNSIPVHADLRTGLERVRLFDEGVYRLYTQSAGLESQYVLPKVG